MGMIKDTRMPSGGDLCKIAVLHDLHQLMKCKSELASDHITFEHTKIKEL